MSVDDERPAAGPKPGKSILVFSDGTGNSSSKLFKTNVWRLYRAVDLSETPTAGRRQIAAYDDGVGTSALMPLRLLGGAFGVGLRRNVLDLYRFVCRNYVEGDEIFAFGFSRGAFTVRVLIGLIAQQGLVRASDEVELARLSESAYREFRRCFRLAGNRPMCSGEPVGRDLTALLVTPLRRLRDRIKPLPSLDGRTKPVDRLRFAGVWDTVAAYGTPIAEVTRGIDRWVWPLSMPDYGLSEKVETARHALALDDERDTFHPLLWDELHEARLVSEDRVADDRLRQVWFAGMHADVGGGYPDDSLAHVPLSWMIVEAKAAGLRLKPAAEAEILAAADPFGPVHDSRAGLGSYYRYQPRKVSARVDPPDPTTRAVQDPEQEGRGLLATVRIHSSVARRIAAGTDAYAPIVLPARYEVEGGAAVERLPRLRSMAQERVWDSVWHRRVNFFMTAGATVGLAAMPAVGWFWPPGTCLGPQCTLGSVIRWTSGVLPAFADVWPEAFAARPGTFLFFVASILLLRGRGRTIEAKLRCEMRAFLDDSRSGDATASMRLKRHALRRGLTWSVRSRNGYQRALQTLKWRAVPAVVGPLLLVGLVAALIGLVGIAVAAFHRMHIAAAERSQSACLGAAPAATGALFTTDAPCWLVPVHVVAGSRYQLRVEVTTAWRDGDIAASPIGFSTSRMPVLVRPVAPLLRRSINDPWFRPIIAIEGNGWAAGGVQAVRMRRVELGPVYLGEFVAPASGRPVLAVNDAVSMWVARMDQFYRGRGLNTGAAKVSIVPCGPDYEICPEE